MLTALNHVNIFSDRLDETVAFYSRVLGMVPGWTPDFPVRVQWLYVGDQALVHVVEMKEARSVANVAVDHYAFTVTDFDDTLRRLDAAECPYTLLEMYEQRIRQAFITDPNGVRIELNWRDPAFRPELANRE